MDWPLDVFERTLGNIGMLDPRAVLTPPKIVTLRVEAELMQDHKRLRKLGLCPVVVTELSLASK